VETNDLLVLDEGAGKLALYDSRTGVKLDQLLFPEEIAYSHFFSRWCRLFVLTQHQIAFVLDVSGNPPIASLRQLHQRGRSKLHVSSVTGRFQCEVQLDPARPVEILFGQVGAKLRKIVFLHSRKGKWCKIHAVCRSKKTISSQWGEGEF